MNYYRLYNLSVCSDIWFPDLEACAIKQLPNPDITIQQGNLADFDHGQGECIGPFLHACENELWMNIPRIATFHISNGQDITYEPAVGIDQNSLSVFIMASCFGALLMQRGYLILHGNAIQIDDGCVICVGHSGAGKSTLAAAMLQKGYPLFSDDLCAIDNAGKIIPGLPRLKIWKDVANILKINTENLIRVREGLEKYYLPMGNGYAEQSIPIKSIYILATHNNLDLQVKRVKGFEKFNYLRAHTYRKRFIRSQDQQKQHLLDCSHLGKNIKISMLNRPKDKFEINELVDFILEDNSSNARL